MRLLHFFSLLIILLLASSAGALYGQDAGSVPSSQEISEREGIPVLVKHLPEWEVKKDSAIFLTKKEDLLLYLNNRPVLNSFDFVPGSEAVIASYPEGKLLIVEFPTPQASSDADRRVRRFIADNEAGAGYEYRRIGNYNAFVFDRTDGPAANVLLDQIKYEKVVQWLGPEPGYLLGAQKEREFILGASSLFISTMIVILTGLGTSVVLGIIAGFFYFYFREHRRASMTAFSDFGGMTRLNLDGLSVENEPSRLLEE